MCAVAVGETRCGARASEFSLPWVFGSALWRSCGVAVRVRAGAEEREVGAEAEERGVGVEAEERGVAAEAEERGGMDRCKSCPCWGSGSGGRVQRFLRGRR